MTAKKAFAVVTANTWSYLLLLWAMIQLRPEDGLAIHGFAAIGGIMMLVPLGIFMRALIKMPPVKWR